MTKILIDRAMIEQALEALEKINKLSVGENAICLPAEIDGAMDALRAALAEPVQKPPKWKLVPTEPTIGMCIAGDEARQNVDDLTRTPAIYRAMIAAAPAAQEQTEPVATFDEVWNAIDWDKWRKEPIRELVQMIHSKTSPRAAQGREPVQEPRTIRMERVDRSTSQHWWSEAARIRMPSPELYAAGDTVLCWVNEGDLLMAGLPKRPAKPVQEPVWNDLKEWCKQHNISPAHYDDLYSLLMYVNITQTNLKENT